MIKSIYQGGLLLWQTEKRSLQTETYDRWKAGTYSGTLE